MHDLAETIENFLSTAKKPLIVILGPTAAGKTALSIQLAKALNGEIVSADSRQIYRGMDIATDKIAQNAREGIPHHLIDIIDPDEPFTLSDYKKIAEKTIDEILEKGKIPFLVGGTGLYINAVTENFQIPEGAPDKNFRQKLEKEAKSSSPKALHAMLAKIDPSTASRIHPKNLMYTIRALEINLSLGKKKERKKGPAKYETLYIGIRWPKEDVWKRIEARVAEQIQRGLLAETEKLMEKYDPALPSMSSLGYRQLIQFLNGEIPYKEAIERIVIETRQYAKRQMTWFKKNPDIIWLDGYTLSKNHENLLPKTH
ncbi:tRNA (adenosine(37)-N6)-dimethylallyltransferase MiaA [Candidatus Peregrinibacteria bacterium]|nr:tRNA (adenosine(37)-N6)-dimethylallyltransferase MiaA [Candidatus Peregrinibacteria bacterium]